ncbi:MAG: hypothetical protein JOY66_07880, partial [Acetobacteraceae bacterium]|nr:hypothetical protein [Acetobacteraceae bacterium]
EDRPKGGEAPGWRLLAQRAVPNICTWHDGWQAVMALFAVWNGVKFLASPTLFARFEVYRFMLHDPLGSQGAWGAVLLGYGLASGGALFTEYHMTRAFLAIAGAGMWLYLGTQLTLGALGANDWIGDGPFMLCAGIGCATVATRRRGE